MPYPAKRDRVTLPALRFDHFGSGQVEDSERNSALAPYWRDAHVLVSLLRMMAHEAAIWFHIAQRLSKLERRENLDGSDKEDLLALYEECRRLGLIMSCLSISRLVRWLDSPVRREDKIYAIKELNRRIADEMAATLFLYVPRERSDYYTEDELFGHKVADVFPSASFDIEEAGKCLALGRGTGCVFHLMRVMEILLRHLGGRLGIPYAPSWESYITQITNRINMKHRAKGIKWKRDEKYFTDVLGDLEAVKIAWRNPICM